MSVDQKALKSYLQAQIELGDPDVFFDEPWTLVSKASLRAPLKKVVIEPPSSSNESTRVSSIIKPPPSSSITSSLDLNSEPPSELYAFQKASHLNDFNTALLADPVYAKESSLLLGSGALRPKAMLLFASPTAEECSAGGIWKTEAGLMLGRLFENLNIEQNQLYFTYFYKREAVRSISSLIEIQLRKMISKEIALVQPELLVLFGEKTLQHIFGRSKMLTQCVGSAMDFGGVNTTVLVDPYDMMQDKNLKRLTWNIHIPASGFFVKR